MAAGLVVLFFLLFSMPVHGAGGASRGTGWSAAPPKIGSSYAHHFTADPCSGARTQRKILSFLLLGIALLASIGVFARRRRA